jgi:hypothetical protein
MIVSVPHIIAVFDRGLSARCPLHLSQTFIPVATRCSHGAVLQSCAALQPVGSAGTPVPAAAAPRRVGTSTREYPSCLGPWQVPVPAAAARAHRRGRAHECVPPGSLRRLAVRMKYCPHLRHCRVHRAARRGAGAGASVVGRLSAVALRNVLSMPLHATCACLTGACRPLQQRTALQPRCNFSACRTAAECNIATPRSVLQQSAPRCNSATRPTGSQSVCPRSASALSLQPLRRACDCACAAGRPAALPGVRLAVRTAQLKRAEAEAAAGAKFRRIGAVACCARMLQMGLPWATCADGGLPWATCCRWGYPGHHASMEPDASTRTRRRRAR